MKLIKLIFLLLIAVLTSFSSNAQRVKDSIKINNLFEKFITEKLSLTSEESIQMKPMVKKYFFQRKKIVQTYSDPLERESQMASLKIQFRNQLTPIVGVTRANSFFIQEQNFRHKVKEELKNRRFRKNN